MPEMYHHQMLGTRRLKLGSIDRFPCTPHGVCEHIVSVTMMTSPEGIIVWALSIDMIDQQRQGITAVPLAYYPTRDSLHCYEDARRLGVNLRLSVRLASEAIGWNYVYDPDGEIDRDKRGSDDMEV